MANASPGVKKGSLSRYHIISMTMTLTIDDDIYDEEADALYLPENFSFDADVQGDEQGKASVHFQADLQDIDHVNEQDEVDDVVQLAKKPKRSITLEETIHFS